jgi:Uncharacterized protein conserved in bacteria (DUF2252)
VRRVAIDRGGDRIALAAAYLGSSATFDEAIANYAASYAEQNNLDHRVLVEPIDQGQIQAQTDI